MYSASGNFLSQQNCRLTDKDCFWWFLTERLKPITTWRTHLFKCLGNLPDDQNIFGNMFSLFFYKLARISPFLTTLITTKIMVHISINSFWDYFYSLFTGLFLSSLPSHYPPQNTTSSQLHNSKGNLDLKSLRASHTMI